MDSCSAFRLEKLSVETPAKALPQRHNAVVLGHFVICWACRGVGAGPLYIFDRVKREWRFVEAKPVPSLEPFRVADMFLYDDLIYFVLWLPDSTWTIFKLDAVRLEEFTVMYKSDASYVDFASCTAFVEPLKEVVLIPVFSNRLCLWNLDSKRVQEPKVTGGRPVRDGMGACCSYKNRVFFAGGQDGGIGLHVLNVDRNIVRWSKPRVDPSSYMPLSRYQLTLTCSGPNRVFAVGGTSARKDMVMFSFTQNRWFGLGGHWDGNQTMPRYGAEFGNVDGHAAVQTNDFIMVFGGRGAYKALTTVFEMRPEPLASKVETV